MSRAGVISCTGTEEKVLYNLPKQKREGIIMVKTVRVGIIGGGMISHRHMQIYKNINERAEELGFRAEIVAIAEIIPERLAEWGKRYGLEEKDQYVDYHDMLKRDDIDTIDVCVHNNLHVPVAIEVMKAGFDCYCEKPAAVTYADAKLMLDCAKKLGRKFHVQISALMTPQTRVAKDYIQSGKLGTPYYVNLEQCTSRRRPGYDLPEFTQDFLSEKYAGHGPSIDLGIYVIGQILFLFDCPKVQSVNAFTGHFVDFDPSLVQVEDGYGVEDTIDGFVKFENGVGFHFLSTSANNYKDYDMTYILGSSGGLEVKYTDTVGGKLARKNPNMGPYFGGEPDLIFRGNVDGRDVEVNLECDKNGKMEVRKDPKMWYYNDNQCMWLAYKLGILDDETRYNTPEIALNQLIVTDGFFLSQKLGRSVTYDEIIENSPSTYVREQMINGKLYKFDTEF